MTNWRKKLLWQIPLICLFAYFANLLSASLGQEFGHYLPETMTNASSYNDRSSGYKAFFEVNERLGRKCERFQKSYRELNGDKSVLLVVAPTVPLLPGDIDHVLEWVAKGNTLVYIDHCMYGTGRYLLNKLSVSATISSSLDNWKCKTIPTTPEFEHVHQLVMSSETRLHGAEEMISDKYGALAVKKKHGDGECYVINAPSLCSNRRISDTAHWGNFQFLSNILAQHSRILFDERAHGYSSAMNAMVYLAKGPAGAILLQGLLIFLLFLYAQNVKFGPIRSVSNARKIASKEYIDGMAHTFLKARANRTAFQILYGSFRLRLCKALSLAPDEKNEVLAQQWSNSTNLSAKETLALLQSAEQLQNAGEISNEELVSVMNECDRLYEASKVHLSVHAVRRLGT